MISRKTWDYTRAVILWIITDAGIMWIILLIWYWFWSFLEWTKRTSIPDYWIFLWILFIALLFPCIIAALEDVDKKYHPENYKDTEDKDE